MTRVSFYFSKDQGENLSYESKHLPSRLKAASKTMSKGEQIGDTVLSGQHCIEILSVPREFEIKLYMTFHCY